MGVAWRVKKPSPRHDQPTPTVAVGAVEGLTQPSTTPPAAKPEYRVVGGWLTKPIGEFDFNTDGTFTTQIWICWGPFPLLPLYGLCVKSAGSYAVGKTANPVLGQSLLQVFGDRSLNAAAIFRVYAYAYGFFAGLGAFLGAKEAGIFFWVFVVLYGAVPFVLRHYAKKCAIAKQTQLG